MATATGSSPDFIKVVKDLIVLEHDAMAAYESTIERLDNKTYAAKISEFLQDHQRHLSELTNFLEGMGQKAPEGADIKVVLTKGKVVIADLFGDDAILTAMKTNEEDTVTAYERASQHENVSDNMRTVLQTAHQDELRHRSWIEQTLASNKKQAA